MRVSVIIPAYRPDTIGDAVGSVTRQTNADWELLAVGQGGEDDRRAQAVRSVVERIASTDRRIRYVHIEQMGACRALNAGMAASAGDVIALLDDDCEAREDWLEKIVDYLERHPDVGVVGGTVVAPPKLKRFGICPTATPREVIYDPDLTPGRPPAGWDWISCNVAYRRDVADRVGAFDEHLGPGADFPAADDTDYRLRLEAAGIRQGVTPTMVVHHTHGYRYGIRVIFDHQHNYTTGNGALCAKLSLQDDPRAQAWLDKERAERVGQWLRTYRVDRVIRGMIGLRTFKRAYRRCLEEYTVEDGVLRARHTNA